MLLLLHVHSPVRIWMDGGAWKACEYCAAERALCVADAVRREFLDGW